jgi:hypothetical protein
MALMGGRRYTVGLQDIARFMRNVRTHLLEKDAAACAAVLGAAPSAVSKDALLVAYFGDRLPSVFVHLLWGTAALAPAESHRTM